MKKILVKNIVLAVNNLKVFCQFFAIRQTQCPKKCSSRAREYVDEIDIL